MSFGLLAQAPASAQQVQWPGGGGIVQPVPKTGTQLLDLGINQLNGYYGGTVYASPAVYLLDIPDEQSRQTVLNYLVMNSYFPTGTVEDSSSLVPVTVGGDPTITNQQLLDFYTSLDGIVSIGDSLARVDYNSADIGTFSNYVVYDANSVIYAPLMSNVRLPSFASTTQPTSTWTDGTTYLWGSPAETFDASVTAICDKNGNLMDCQHKCNAASGALASAEISCEEVSSSANCCKIKYEYAWATGFKSVNITAGQYGVSVTGYIGQSGNGSGTLIDCCSPVTKVSQIDKTGSSTSGRF
jgi:hypothetical protein